MSRQACGNARPTLEIVRMFHRLTVGVPLPQDQGK